MKLSAICFTRKGYEKMKELMTKQHPELEISGFVKCRALQDECGDMYLEESAEEWCGDQFKEKIAVLFIGATGIAVRSIAAHVKNKLTDSPVLVMDDNGRFIIPLLSGHVGGANEIAEKLSEEIGAVPVITTSTDINNKFSVDVFAKKNGLEIINKDGIRTVSSKVLEGKTIHMLCEPDIKADEQSLRKAQERYGDSLTVKKCDDRSKKSLDSLKDEPDVYIGQDAADLYKNVCNLTKCLAERDDVLYLKPKEYILGIGCRRGKSTEEIRKFVFEVLDKNGIDISEICGISSIDVKKDEEGIVSIAAENRIPYTTFSADELNAVSGDFSESEFVRETVGVGNVSERSAMAACKGRGKIVVSKTAGGGITAAIVKREVILSFE